MTDSPDLFVRTHSGLVWEPFSLAATTTRRVYSYTCIHHCLQPGAHL